MLSSPLFGGRSWYQYVDLGDGITTEPHSEGKARERTESFREWLGGTDLVRPGDVVLDIGANAALFSLLLGERCSRAYAVEIDARFFRQAELVKREWENAGRDTLNVELVLGDVFARPDLTQSATIVLASKVLYHSGLGKGPDELLRRLVAGNVRAILMQGHVVHGDVGELDGMKALVERHGFEFRNEGGTAEYPIASAVRR